MKLNAERRQGLSGKSENRFGIELNYQFGLSWDKHFDSPTVPFNRSMAGSKYDLVDRNNHIILEYRKKQVIKLYNAKQVFGYAGDKKSLDVVVNSKYGLSHIEWSAPALLAHGGKIEKEGQTGETQGTYTGTYIARTVGTGLSLKCHISSS